MLETQFEKEQNSLTKLCEENELEANFLTTYPITLIVKPMKPEPEQTELEESAEEQPYNENAKCEIVFGDVPSINFVDFEIDIDALNKIKNSAKKLLNIYLQIWYKKTMQDK